MLDEFRMCYEAVFKLKRGRDTGKVRQVGRRFQGLALLVGTLVYCGD